MQESGIVKSTTGVVTAVAQDGSRRILKVDDSVSSNEQIVTSESGSISIEFEGGGVMDLGRNAEASYEEQVENPGFEKSASADDEAEVEAIQLSLIQGEETYDPSDPTVTREAPGAGPTPALPTEDDGHNIVQVDYNEPRMTPVNGYETTGITVDFPELEPELIQDPLPQAVGAAAPAVAGDDGTPPLVSSGISGFTERGGEVANPLLADDKSGFLIFRTDPSQNTDSVTNITVTGLSQSDWQINSRNAEIFDAPHAYSVSIDLAGSNIASGTISFNVAGATGGEDVAFKLNVTPNDPGNFTLGIQTTVNGGQILPPVDVPVTVDV